MSEQVNHHLAGLAGSEPEVVVRRIVASECGRTSPFYDTVTSSPRARLASREEIKEVLLVSCYK